jgi:hypothetical protein
MPRCAPSAFAEGSDMRTRSIGHAALEIEASGLRLLTDPWWAGPAYTNQWHAWPTPQPAGVESRQLDYVYISHGHEDHLHADTLRQLRPGAAALIPEFLTGSAADFLTKELRFCQVIPLRHGRTVELRRGLRATCYVNLTDSMLVLEDGDRVLVNANDALHASPPAVLDHFCRLLRRNHATVDTLFLGYSGASWFPNCVRVPGVLRQLPACGRPPPAASGLRVRRFVCADRSAAAVGQRSEVGRAHA